MPDELELLKIAFDRYDHNVGVVLTLWSYLYIAAAAVLGFAWKELASAPIFVKVGLSIAYLLFSWGNWSSMKKAVQIAKMAADHLQNSHVAGGPAATSFIPVLKAHKYMDVNSMFFLQQSFAFAVALGIWLPEFGKYLR